MLRRDAAARRRYATRAAADYLPVAARAEMITPARQRASQMAADAAAILPCSAIIDYFRDALMLFHVDVAATLPITFDTLTMLKSYDEAVIQRDCDMLPYALRERAIFTCAIIDAAAVAAAAAATLLLRLRQRAMLRQDADDMPP